LLSWLLLPDFGCTLTDRLADRDCCRVGEKLSVDVISKSRRSSTLLFLANAMTSTAPRARSVALLINSVIYDGTYFSNSHSTLITELPMFTLKVSSIPASSHLHFNSGSLDDTNATLGKTRPPN
jgi:hypothetical protein